MNLIHRLIREEQGQTYVEYGLLVALIGVLLVTVTTNLKDGISRTFTAAINALPKE